MNHFTFVKANDMCYTPHIHCSIVYFYDTFESGTAAGCPQVEEIFFDEA